jgi:hypothetical protein
MSFIESDVNMGKIDVYWREGCPGGKLGESCENWRPTHQSESLGIGECYRAL